MIGKPVASLSAAVTNQFIDFGGDLAMSRRC